MRMMAIAVAALILGPVQDRTIDAQIDAFLKGDEAARTELLKRGVTAIRPLQASRDRGPAPCDALVQKLKFSATHPRGFRLADAFDTPFNLQGQIAAHPKWTMQFRRAGIPLFPDRFDRGRLKSGDFNLRNAKTPLAALEDLCRQTGLDYGFFHNAVVLAKSDRLWPSGPPAKRPDLDAEALARARRLVESLGDDSIEARESAMKDLMSMGPAVVPVLEANWGRNEGEIAARCAALIDALRLRAHGAFGPAGAELQRLGAEDEKLLRHLQGHRLSVNLRDTRMAEIADYLGESCGVPIETAAAVADSPASISLQQHKAFDVLALATQSAGLDFTIQAGKVRIDSRESVDKLVSGAK